MKKFKGIIQFFGFIIIRTFFGVYYYQDILI